MSSLPAYLLLSLAVMMTITNGGSTSKYSVNEIVCRFLSDNFIASYPGTSYPIIYEPIKNGRLTIWTGISTLPTSEFRCHGALNNTNSILLDFAHFVNKLDWTFYDLSKGVTHYGTSVSHCEDYTYNFDVKNKQSESYLECNLVDAVKQMDTNRTVSTIHTTCHDCSKSMLELINAKVKELIKRKVDEQLIDNLYWHLSGLLSNHHFNGPVSFKDNLD